jgi:hypothetical protein
LITSLDKDMVAHLDGVFNVFESTTCQSVS